MTDGLNYLLQFQSTPSGWRETLAAVLCLGGDTISIHSLRVEGDNGRLRRLSTPPISIHSLRVEGDCRKYRNVSSLRLFQSTPSVWRETTLYRIYSTQEDISIHSLRVEGDTLQRIADTLNAISIHSLRVEGDTINSLCSISSAYFNPLPPCGGRQIIISEIRR